MLTTAALVPAQGADFELAEVELDDPRDDEVLVRLVATGVCHTDITMRGFLPPEMFPHVFGHEGAGVVEAVGTAVTGLAPGDHVVLSLRSCRACAACRDGLSGYCEQALLLNYMGMRLDGSTTLRRGEQQVFGSFFGQSSFARHALAYADNCVKVDPALDLSLAAPFGCGFQTGAGTVLDVLGSGPQDSLVVYGAGAVGLAACAAARAAAVGTLVAVDLLPDRLAEAERSGAVGVDASALTPDEVVARVKEVTGGGATHGIDTTAAATVVQQGLRSLGTRGRFVALGLGAFEYTVDAIDLLQGGKTLLASLEGDADPQEMVPRLLGLRAAGTFDVDHLVTTYPADRINDAVADMLSGRVVKPVLTW